MSGAPYLRRIPDVNFVDRRLERLLPDTDGRYPKEGTVNEEGTHSTHGLVGRIVVAEVLPVTGREDV